MPLKGSNKADYQREYMRRRREVHTKGSQLTEEGITEYHPVLAMLVDPVKREKLERICEALGKRNLQSKVFLGLRHPVSFDIIEDLLEATG